MTPQQMRTIAAKLDQGTPLTYDESLGVQAMLHAAANAEDTMYDLLNMNRGDLVEHYDEGNSLFVFAKWSGHNKRWPQRYVATGGREYQFRHQEVMLTDAVSNFAGYAKYERV